MSKTQGFFNEYLPNKLQKNPDLASSVNQIYQFDITGAGTWTVDLTSGQGAVAEGAHDNPGCTITCAEGDFEGLLDSPQSAMMLMTTGKLKISNLMAAMSLQKIL